MTTDDCRILTVPICSGMVTRDRLAAMSRHVDELVAETQRLAAAPRKGKPVLLTPTAGPVRSADVEGLKKEDTKAPRVVRKSGDTTTFEDFGEWQKRQRGK